MRRYISYPSLPRFPHDIERLIVEQAASDDNDTALQLALVTKRVQRWVDPIIYESIIIDSPYHAERMKPPEGYANFVKELSLHYFSNRQRIHIASLCTRVIKLQITDTAPFFDWWGKPHPLDTAIGGFRPRHLTTEINFVYHLHPRTDSDITGCKEVPEFHRPFYSNVTHLCLLARPGLYTSLYCAGLGKLPRLTHLAVEVFTPGPENIATYGVRVLRKHIAGILSDCKSLELLLIQVNSVDVLYEYNETKATIETLEDPRVVVIIRGLPTRRDTGVAIQKVWPYAETHVKMRKWEGLKTPICVWSAAPFAESVEAWDVVATNIWMLQTSGLWRFIGKQFPVEEKSWDSGLGGCVEINSEAIEHQLFEHHPGYAKLSFLLIWAGFVAWSDFLPGCLDETPASHRC